MPGNVKVANQFTKACFATTRTLSLSNNFGIITYQNVYETMDVLNEILEWSETRPPWQREALRLIVLKGNLMQEDIDELLVHCKFRHGLSAKIAVNPLLRDHIPSQTTTVEPVILNSLTHEKGVNALANNQTINFGKSLTVVYGQNAAGKSGYTRVLKKACRARGSEEILGNVLTERAPGKPSATLVYSISGKEYRWNWTDGNIHNPALGNVSVFDRHCATVYLSQKTDVAFRPFGLDLFDKLAACCEKLRNALEKERQELNRIQFEVSIPEGTKAYSLIADLTALSDVDSIREVANLTAEELTKIKSIKKQIHELNDEDIGKSRRGLELKLKRIKSFRSDLEKLKTTLSTESIKAISSAVNALEAKRKLAEKLATDFSKFSKLEGSGSNEWKELWTAASDFSQVAYPTKEFPFLKKDAHCVLCQQKLDEGAVERFSFFSKFMSSTVQRDLEESAEHLQSVLASFEKCLGNNLHDSDALKEIEIEHESSGKELSKILLKSERELKQIIQSAKSGKQIVIKEFDVNLKGIALIENELEQRLKALAQGVDKGSLRKLESELKELEARKLLSANLSGVIKEIERQKKMAVYSLCLNDVTTTSITKKSTEITKKVVTEHLIESFHKELSKLGFNHLEIDLEPSGATRGALYHKLVIKRAPNIEVQNVVSEGEARALSIAAFFSELSTASNPSGILFDDPVSSLDHMWRERVATRLVEESQNRQVIVFTHDIVFLTTLNRIAEERSIEISHQYIHREHEGAGVSSPDLPWVAMRVKDRLGVLNRRLQDIVKIEKTLTRERYESEASMLYGLLREAWERALEEVLVGGIIERYRPSIQSLKVKYLADITKEDCDVFDSGMTKCSRWLPGHDNASAESAPFPNSNELRQDLEALDVWVREINKRRK